MQARRSEFDPYDHDALRWGASMAHHAELVLTCLDAVGARSVGEIGAYAGDLTRVLVEWAAETGAGILAIDPAPQPQLIALAEQHPALELHVQRSLEALAQIELPDVLIIDGDHNYFTVAQELSLVAQRASGPELPLLLFHDVCWPHGRRDDYFDPSQIPADYRHPVVGDHAGITPENPGIAPDGLPYHRSAAVEGGPRNGVLTAVEEFVAGSEKLRLAVVSAFFGFGAAWHADAPWATSVGELFAPYDRHPLLERLEANRVHHIAQGYALRIALWEAQERQARQQRVLRRLLESSAFGVAERLSALRVRAGVAPQQSVISRDQVRQALED